MRALVAEMVNLVVAAVRAELAMPPADRPQMVNDGVLVRELFKEVVKLVISVLMARASAALGQARI